MPPESLPWDRKDLSKERKKRERSSDPMSPVSKWRETPHHDSSSARDYNRRNVCGFRGRPAVSAEGYGKLGDWHNYPGQSSKKIEVVHGEQGGCHHYVGQSGCGLSSSEKIVDGETGRPFGSRVDERCVGNSRESRPFFRQKDWEGHSLENGGSTEGSGKLLNHSAQRSPVHAREKLHSKDQHNKIENVSELGTGQRSERGSLLCLIERKPHKWTRSGIMSARSSGFTRSSFSKSSGADSSDAKAKVQKSVIPVESHLEDWADRAQSAAPIEETSSGKKPRVRWGEGLAKFERKNVDVPTKHGMVDCGSTEVSSSDFPNLADKSPRLSVFSEFASPTTPSSIAFSSSSGMEEKRFLVSSRDDIAIFNGSGSSVLHSKDHVEARDFDLESLDTTSFAKLSSLLSKLLQFGDPTSEGFGLVRATAMDKLQVWKSKVTKALEMTESEIDSLENELRLLKSGSGNNSDYTSAFSSLTGKSDIETHAVQVTNSDSIPQLAGLQLVSCGDLIMEEHDKGIEEVPDPLRGKGADSPGTVKTKFIDSLPSLKDDTLFDWVKDSVGSADLDTSTPRILEQEVPIYSCKAPVLANVHGDREIKLYDLIIASNKECAKRAFNVFKQLLPSDGCTVDISRTSMVSNKPSNTLIKEKIAARKRFLKFKERVLTFKFMVFRHVWKKDIQLLNAREFHEKSQRRLKSSIQKLRCSNQKHRSSHRSRFSRVGNLNVVPAVDVINFTSKLLSGSQFKLQRDFLRMPAMVLDKKEKTAMQFVSRNGLVQNPCAVEKERALINPWTTEEKEIFMDKLVIYGKDFRKIASFLDHKTTADCVEFYYKNHKSECFGKTNKKLKFAGQEQSRSAHNYLVTSGNQWNRGANAASLDVINTTSAVAATAGKGIRSLKNPKPRFSLGVANKFKASHPDLGTVERLGKFEGLDTVKETVAVSVLAGICGSPSSQAMSSCSPSSFDSVEGYQDSKCQNFVSSIRRPLTPEVADLDNQTCSDESSHEMFHTDWTDDEKSVFVQAVTTYGTDFAIISQHVKTKSKTQCKVFFSKARDRLGLNMIGRRSEDDIVLAGNGDDSGGSESDCPNVFQNGSVICSERSESKLDDGLALGCKVDMEMKHSSEVEKGIISQSNMDELLKAGELDEHMVDLNMKNYESYPADSKSLLSINSVAAYDFNMCQSGLAVSSPAQSCPVVAAHLMPMATGNKRYGDVCSKKQASLQTHTKMDWDASSGKSVLKPCGLCKCGSESHSSPSDSPCLSVDNRSNHGHTDSLCSSDLVNPCKNSGVKLFGKILTCTSTQQNHSIGGICKNNQKAS